MNGTLLENLTRKREEIRSRPSESGRAPLVCSDAALTELARLRPKTKQELLYVSGLGKTFADKYGDEFMLILDEYRKEKAAATEAMAPKVRETLKNLENRLVNINRRNRLLYMPKLGARYAVDLVGGADAADGKETAKANNAASELRAFKLVEFLKKQDKGARFKLLDLSEGDPDAVSKKYTEYKTLAREAERNKRESGEATLYVGYPFVQGKMVGEDFTVRAPLALFPATLTVGTDSVVLSLDTDKDVVFNSALVLSHFKFTGQNAVVEDNVLDEVRQYKFIDDVLAFFESYGIVIENKSNGKIKKFVSYTAAKFPKYRAGQFELVENAVIGRFSLCSDALQRDFRKLIESDSINELLNELLQAETDKDIYSDSEEEGDSPDITPPSERGLNYINDLNISQENAIINMDTTDRLVLQGPPGTGKSQVITSMIADCVNEGGNVLMVSQKKAALDVIYSRLGNLSRYAVMIGDVKDKETFYDSLAKVFAAAQKTPYSQAKFNSASDRIDGVVSRLDGLGEKLFYDEKYGAPMCDIYDENFDNPFKNGDALAAAVYSDNICLELSALGYETIKECRDYFADGYLLQTCREYYELNDRFPWLFQVKNGLSGMEVNAILKEIDEVVDEFVRYRAKNFFGRLFGKGKYRKALKAVLKNYFTDKSGKIEKTFFADPTILYNGFKQYEKHRELATATGQLSKEQKLYFGCMYNVLKASGKELSQINQELKDYIAYYYITQFESENRDVAGATETFDITVRDIGNLFNVKKEESKSRFKAALADCFVDNVLNSKRRGEIMRVMESKRRQSIPKFVKKFGFELFKGLKIWLMTPEAVSEILPLENDLFGMVIFDEASQIYIERGVPAIARGKKVVIAGDHKQLRPSSLGDGRMDVEEMDEEESDAALEEESLLDLARFRFPEIMLDYHYRSRYEELIAFSNYAFYKGRLNISPNTSLPTEPPISVHKVENGLWEDRRNAAEARAVVNLLKEYLDRDTGLTIGVITFNSSQRDLIRDMLDSECAENPEFAAKLHREENRAENGEDVGLFVKNIENVQGDERDVIIFSLAYAKSSSGKVVRNFGWLNQTGGENRLNVAVSRAKRKIHIITSIEADELKVDDLKNEGPRIFKKYLEYAYAVSRGNTEAANAVLASFSSAGERTEETKSEFADAVYEALKQSGLKLERNVGMGRYKIDIAVKDDDGNYLLGVECDGNLYRRLPIARERDVHRARYLEARGWKIYRVWSSKWYHDSRGQVEKIKAAAYEKK